MFARKGTFSQSGSHIMYNIIYLKMSLKSIVSFSLNMAEIS